MAGFFSFSFSLIFSLTLPLPSFPATFQSLQTGSSLTVDNQYDILISPDGKFSAGFHSVGVNVYCFSIWFTKSANKTVVWMANRDQPINGRLSELSLRGDGNLVLTDAGHSEVWSTNTTSTTTLQLRLLNTGNLALQTLSENLLLWQSFDFPTDTLLPQQVLTKNTKLVSYAGKYNYSSGFYSLFFDNNNVLSLLYSSPDVSSIYWPYPGRTSLQVGRTPFNSTRIALLDVAGHLLSSDGLDSRTSDYGIGPMRRLTIDYDGNLRIYSLNEIEGSWVVSFIAITLTCTIHGLCGPNGLCVYELERRCTCPPLFRFKDPSDWSKGCEPTFNISCDPNDSKLVGVRSVNFYGYDIIYVGGTSVENCKNLCLKSCSCKAMLYQLDGRGRCWGKTKLRNGYQSPNFYGTVYFKVPKNVTVSPSDGGHIPGMELGCSTQEVAPVELARTFRDPSLGRSSLYFLVWFAYAVGLAELLCLLTGWFYMTKKNRNSHAINQGYHLAATGSKKFTYRELKKATQNFCREIGRGAGGVVYIGSLSDGQVVAVKRLQDVNQGEEEFLAEVTTVGRINHMNLITMVGFCAEGKHRLLVYEYMEKGSLAENLASKSLDFEKMFRIAVGMAKGLAYLHEECLEWILHCDIKPQNILIEVGYQPKLSDFGLSKLRDRSSSGPLNLSKVRGTRGYMAPEWISNQPITSKVDVYSYGIVVLEMVTGRSSMGSGIEQGRLIPWLREIIGGETSATTWIEEIVDPEIGKEFDKFKMEVLVRVALTCVEDDKDARPTMSQVLQMLLRNELMN